MENGYTEPKTDVVYDTAVKAQELTGRVPGLFLSEARRDPSEMGLARRGMHLVNLTDEGSFMDRVETRETIDADYRE